jgi:hypothetical protein
MHNERNSIIILAYRVLNSIPGLAILRGLQNNRILEIVQIATSARWGISRLLRNRSCWELRTNDRAGRKDPGIVELRRLPPSYSALLFKGRSDTNSAVTRADGTELCRPVNYLNYQRRSGNGVLFSLRAANVILQVPRNITVFSQSINRGESRT